MQDTPVVKATYDASVTVPQKFVVKMSANETSVVQGKSQSGEDTKTYKFKSDIKIPSYLIALAVGDLQRASLGKRTGVITEPS